MKLLLDRALNRERRFWEYAEGNRNPYTAAKTYWSLLGGYRQAARKYVNRLSLDSGGIGKLKRNLRQEGSYIHNRTSALIQVIRDDCLGAALRAYRRNPVTANRHINGAYVYAVILGYSQANGYCSAKQGSIGNAVRDYLGTPLSRQATHDWIDLLIEAGLVKVVGFDCRGYKQWTDKSGNRRRPIRKWCKVLRPMVALSRSRLVGSYWNQGMARHSGGGDTIPKVIADVLPVQVKQSGPPPGKHRRRSYRWLRLDRGNVYERIDDKVMATIDCYLIARDGEQWIRRPALRVLAFVLLSKYDEVYLLLRE